MKGRIVRLGKSHFIRIPQQLLDQTGLRGDVEIAVENNAIVIRRASRPRAGWEAAFREMAERGDDRLLDDISRTLSQWDEDEWQWQ